jgi:radical SAM superfamily enzyme YgiQ (UPF0313 family)
VNVLLISTYELGRQPFGLASPAAWLGQAGHAVRCLDLSRESFDEAAVRWANLVAFYVPMHTATRLAAGLMEPARLANPNVHICFYGLYAPVNEPWLRRLGAQTVLGGEFESGLVLLANRLSTTQSAQAETSASAQSEPAISMARQQFLVPDRSLLVPLDRYARLRLPDGQDLVSGYTEASRGCKHRCRHCPIVPVYDGAFRVVQPEIVLEDVRRQVRAGARHITFGDPDFFNGPRHALEIVRALHVEFPDLGYDVTIKVEHLLARAADLAVLRDTGCRFVTSAVESLDDEVLAKLEKGHTRADFLECVALMRRVGLPLQPTFVPFTPWTTLDSYLDLLDTLASFDLTETVAPVQLAIRLLVPAGSRLLDLDDMRPILGPFDPAALAHPWRHADLRVDDIQREVAALVENGHSGNLSRVETFARVHRAAQRAAGRTVPPPVLEAPRLSRAAIPFLTEPWYC